MPYQGPGERYEAIATKATSHGLPAVENNFGGIAAKTQQIAPAAPSVANAAAAVAIAITEPFVIMLSGVHEVATSRLPGGAAVGDPLWIRASDNTLQNAATSLTSGITNAGFVKFGRIQSIDSTLGRALVNLRQRSSF